MNKLLTGGFKTVYKCGKTYKKNCWTWMLILDLWNISLTKQKVVIQGPLPRLLPVLSATSCSLYQLSCHESEDINKYFIDKYNHYNIIQ